jgi:hypothetical protein
MYQLRSALPAGLRFGDIFSSLAPFRNALPWFQQKLFPVESLYLTGMLNLGPLGQLPGVCTYTLLTLGFRFRDENQQAVISLLEKAAGEIIFSYPWLAGQIVNDMPGDEKEASSGTYKVIEYKPHGQTSKFIHVKDCKKLLPKYEDIVKARAPLSMLDGSIISPAYGFPYMYPSDVTQPVILMQANFVQGGLLLTSCGHHLTMDANGHEQFLRQFARLCRSEKLLEEHVHFGNADQQTIIPPLNPGEKPSPLQMLRCPSKLNDRPGAWPPSGPGATWKCFRFTAAKIAALKVEALKDCSTRSNVKYISSNDAVTTFIFSSLTAFRSKTLPEDSRTMLIRAVNSRKRLDPSISEGYMGHSILCCYTTLPLSKILKNSLSTTAIKVRQSLIEVNDHQARSFFHLLKAEKDRTTFNYGAKMNPATDLMITSFAGQQLYSTSFGDLLGMPDFVRRPRLPDGKGLCYLLPKTRDGDIDIVIGLSDEEYEGLKGDLKWNEFAEAIE